MSECTVYILEFLSSWENDWVPVRAYIDRAAAEAACAAGNDERHPSKNPPNYFYTTPHRVTEVPLDDSAARALLGRGDE